LVKIQIGLTFLIPAYPACPGKEAVKWVSLCVCLSSGCYVLRIGFYQVGFFWLEQFLLMFTFTVSRMGNVFVVRQDLSVAYIYAVCGDAGFFLTRHSELMLTNRLKELYHLMLASPADSPTTVRLLSQVLTNIHSYLVEEELKMMKAEAECKCKTL